jgi:hypothetical protein
MSASKRQRITDAVKTGFEAILTENGYNSDLGESVHEWRSRAFAESELPAAVLRDLGETAVAAVGVHEHSLTMEAEIVLSGHELPAEIRALIADVTACIGADVTWGGLAEATYPPDDEAIAIEQANRQIAGVRIRFVIEYTTEPFNPYE